MALTISRYGQVRGRPGPLWLVGNRGVRRCHCLSFKSVGYARRDCIFIPRVYLTRFQNALLGRPQVEAMVEKVTNGKSLPVEVLQQIVTKTDGVPLFVEELTKMVLESGLLREEEGQYVGAHGGAPIPPLAIPSTLQDSLMARLD